MLPVQLDGVQEGNKIINLLFIVRLMLAAALYLKNGNHIFVHFSDHTVKVSVTAQFLRFCKGEFNFSSMQYI